MRASQKRKMTAMDETKANLVALVEADADNARRRAERLRMLAKFIVGDGKAIAHASELGRGFC